jgi:creatinine amidohydrolase/Fe(II)-dependent formamide hydrolase-like protein
MARFDMSAMTSPQLATLGREEKAVGLIPLGAVEQHGPHLPVGTDAMIAEHLAAEISSVVPVPTLVAPVLPFGISDHHLGFAGTVHVPEDALAECVHAYIRTMEALGLSRIALFSAHGGNFGCIERVVSRYAEERVSVIGYSDIDSYMSSMAKAAAAHGVHVPGSDMHAGGLETSQMLYLHGANGVRPETVPDGFARDGGDWRAEISGKRVKEISANGIMGLPRLANAEVGRAICEALTAELSAWIVREFNLR